MKPAMLYRILYILTPTLLLMLAAFMVSCGNDHSTVEPPLNDVPVSFTLAIPEQGQDQEASTRAYNNRWEAGDKVGIYMVDHGTTQLPGRTEGNYPYVTAQAGESSDLTPGGVPLIYPEDYSEVNFIAYYPYVPDLHTTYSHVYPVNVAKHDAQTQEQLNTEVDLLYHKGTTPYKRTSPTATLNFVHQLSKLTIRLYPAPGVMNDLTDATVTLSGFPTTAEFDLSAGGLSNPGGSDVNLHPKRQPVAADANESLFEMILVPHQGTDYSSRELTFTIEGETYQVAIPESRNVEQSTAYIYSYKFNGHDVELVQNTIVDWNSGNVARGDYLITASRIYVDLAAVSSTGNTVDISTNSPFTPTITLSEEANSNTTTIPDWITTPALSQGTTNAEGWTSYTLTFGVKPNIETVHRIGYIRLDIDGIVMPIRVTQAKGIGMYVNDPVPASFTGISYAGETNKTFTIETNSTATSIESLTTNNPAMITNLSSARSVKDAANGIYTWTITFNVANNTSSARNGNINVTIGEITKTIPVAQISGLPAQSSNTNCYIVAPGSQTIYIPVTRAVNNGLPSSASFTAVKLWDDNLVIASVGTEGSGSSDYITVTVNSNSREGNALVALRSGNDIYWSWHIWVTTYNPNPVTTSNSWTYNNGSTNYIFMDRNLGATDNDFSAASFGLFYQWGRKDPFPAKDLPSGFLRARGPVDQETAHRNPEKFYYNTSRPHNWLSTQDDNLWGNNASKNVNDPCPEGWRVPYFKNNISPWNGLSLLNFNWSGLGFQYGRATTSRHPVPGWRGYRYGEVGFTVNVYGRYWSASPTSSNAFHLYFLSTGLYLSESGERGNGYSVRCVKE